MYELRDIKGMRRRLNLTQKKLAEISGVSQSMVAKIEAGRIEPSYKNAMQILNALTVELNKKEKVAGELMSKRIIGVAGTTSVAEAVRKMKRYEISQLPVFKGATSGPSAKIIGLVSETSLITALINKGRMSRVSDVMDDPPPLIPKNTPSKAVYSMLRFYPLLIVVDRDKPVGVITKSDIIRRLY